jgi:5-carboxymethyl-2-hydroxymuconate isomerase
MPHIHLETTSDLPENSNIPDILEALALELSRHETIKSESIKAYHSLRSNWAVGSGHPAGFGHCTVSILAGRPTRLKKEIAGALGEVLKHWFAESIEAGEVGLTLEIREMDPETYLRLHV